MDERFFWFSLGCLLGLILGTWLGPPSRILSKVKELKNRMKNQRNESGFFTNWNFRNFALIVVLILTVYAAFSSQRASNESQEVSKNLTTITVCNKNFLVKTIDALNQRTQYTLEQAKANVRLQKDQSTFLALILQEPRASDKEGEVALREYFDSITNFVIIQEKAIRTVRMFPFPTRKALSACLSKE